MKHAVLAGAVLLGLMGTAAQAGENPNLNGGAPVVLATNDSVVLTKQAESQSQAAQPEYESLISGGKVHQYLGIATVGAAAATFLTHTDRCEGAACINQPPRSLHNSHANLGRATALLATATVISGLIAHWDDFAAEDGISDPDNLHVLLGAGGAALMAYAINKSMNSTTPVNHAALAELGALSMIMAIKLTW